MFRSSIVFSARTGVHALGRIRSQGAETCDDDNSVFDMIHVMNGDMHH